MTRWLALAALAGCDPPLDGADLGDGAPRLFDPTLAGCAATQSTWKTGGDWESDETWEWNDLGQRVYAAIDGSVDSGREITIFDGDRPVSSERYVSSEDHSATWDTAWTWDDRDRLVHLSTTLRTGSSDVFELRAAEIEYHWEGDRIRRAVRGGSVTRYRWSDQGLVARIDGGIVSHTLTWNDAGNLVSDETEYGTTTWQLDDDRVVGSTGPTHRTSWAYDCE